MDSCFIFNMNQLQLTAQTIQCKIVKTHHDFNVGEDFILDQSVVRNTDDIYTVQTV